MRLRRWIATVAGLAAAGAVAGRLFGGVMAGLSPDYPALVSDFTMLGLKLGLVAGTTLAACQGVGERPPPPLGRTVRAIGLLAGIAIAGLGVVFALLSVDEIRALYAHHVLDIRLDRLANPGRYVLFRGLRQGAVVGTMAGTLIGGVYLWRGRGEAGRASDSPSRPA